MFRFLRQTNIDFLSLSTPALTLSAIAMVASIGILIFNGLNLGIEFAGGTELQLKFRDAPDLAEIRSTLSSGGVPNAVVTTIGKPEQHEVYIKIASDTKDQDDSSDLTRSVTDALRADSMQPGREDLNVIESAVLEELLAGAPGVDPVAAAELSSAITELRTDQAFFDSADDLAGLPGMDATILEHLEGRTFAGPVALRSQSYVGPAIGRELMRNAMGAVFGSLLGMLVYIWIRFQLQWGFAAVLALAHDTLIALGLFSAFGKELSLPVVAAFLTLVGYSVNDTVVVFDRIRENLRLRAGKDLRSIVNLSINQTLSRTVITSGLTFVVVFGLLIFGGRALNPFSFVLTAGVIVGTYSSIFIASPLLVLWKERRGRGDVEIAASSPAKPNAGTARKVRTGS